ncbi:MAG: ATP-dependent sacrificial sulfur transferase LarE [Tissierellia bacterium]|nr:ATP-dependent sacrificial sulfur transferase LarE [Tissierellia bacterium]
MQSIDEKEKNLIRIIKGYDKIALAFSGGVDSSFLLYFAGEIIGRENILAITVNMSMHTSREKRESIELAKDFKHIFIDAEEYSLRAFVENSKDRCYHCKKDIFNKIKSEAKKRGFLIVCDGTNRDDLDDYRPGLIALRELDIKSPLKEAGLGKDEIRELSKKHGIPTWNKPSKACLASRIPYGTEITPEAIKTVENCEEYLINLGYPDSRVRHHGSIARIEIPVKDIESIIKYRKEIDSFFKSQGFLYTTLDLAGYNMGSLNKEIDLK